MAAILLFVAMPMLANKDNSLILHVLIVVGIIAAIASFSNLYLIKNRKKEAMAVSRVMGSLSGIFWGSYILSAIADEEVLEYLNQ